MNNHNYIGRGLSEAGWTNEGDTPHAINSGGFGVVGLKGVSRPFQDVFGRVVVSIQRAPARTVNPTNIQR